MGLCGGFDDGEGWRWWFWFWQRRELWTQEGTVTVYRWKP